MAITASFSDGELRVSGDDADNAITISRTPAGEILVNGGAVAISGGTPTVANTNSIQILGQGLNDSIILDEANGVLPFTLSFGGDGTDTLSAGAGADNLDSGSGNDMLNGKDGEDLMFGDDGDDTLIGGDGDDRLSGGDGNDRLIWNPGDDDDRFEGGRDSDTAEVNGNNAAEVFTVAADGTRVRFDRIDPTPFSLDIGTTETLVVNMGGGADALTVNDLGGTDVTTVAVNLAAAPSSTAGDGAVDTVSANATLGADLIAIVSNATGTLTVNGLAAKLVIEHGDASSDQLIIKGGSGEDLIDASGVAAGQMGLTLDGGSGSDVLIGSAGDDTINGGGDNDLALMGSGSDTFVWNPGDGNDFVEGGDGADTLRVGGRPISDSVEIAAIGERVQLLSDDGAILNMNDVETITFNALDRADAITVHDLSGTDVKTVAIALGNQDQVSDGVLVEATNGNDAIRVTASGTSVVVSGLAAQVTIDGAEGAKDRLVVDGLDGNDTIDASGLAASVIELILDGGAGDDTLLGSQGADVIGGSEGSDAASYAASTAAVTVNLVSGDNTGGDAQGDFLLDIENVIGSAHADTLTGDDLDNTLDGGAGGDTLIGGQGDDVLIGGAGADTAVFNVDFNAVDVVFEGGKIFIESAEGRDAVNGIENLQFTDGTIHLDDGNPLVNDLFYFARNKDVWDAGLDADFHYNAVGWLEGRDPSALFSTNGYLSANADVRAAHINPLLHFDQVGWREGRDPSANFDVQLYLERNPDVAAAGINPLAHFEAAGRDEGREAFAAIGNVTHQGFDAEFYLLGNPDVGFAGVDPFWHYHAIGFQEGRDPNAFFDSAGYLAAYGDVAAAGIDPLAHYMTFGAQEGRDPSGAFDTKAYLAANPDVAAAGVNPLQHFLQFGVHEGRLPLGDGIFA